ncbi:MAG: ABC transporter-related protein [Methanomicrobiales archaeon 53_19]|jgi:ABC-2 type transport system ATP-binding protein|uniref:ABC transporter ATP-binding protein n=1 Tax=Methanocalculus sp. TaxID=2004547 RepID=UPI0007496CB7|nr:ABC transporter ATP-binding protein [Methanocalculus sp.]KUK71137.1 MAG: ABC transporter-related protein [Methanocalculus sp. 52_23]KUL04997.1 MAG: ABC transporter-related protein [Methanomicrobiales archaeon 53_19]HIJ05998.1 ABC transporter ATP-binding protein [Methanocalculus sp.]
MHAIRAENLSKSFDGRVVLDNVSFSVEKGDIFGYLGPNGAGKTTTINLFLGLLTPDGGTATVNGADLGSDDEARRRIGVLFENNGFSERQSAYENLRYYGRLYGMEDPDSRVDELLGMIGLNDRAADPVGTFSTGMKRKLGIARAILHKPDLLFLDEPSSGLDPDAQRMVRDLILSLASSGGMTVFINSHHLDEVQRICSRVAILAGGQIQAEDSVARLTASGKERTVWIAFEGGNASEHVILAVQNLPMVERAEREGEGIICTLTGEGRVPDLISALVAAGFRIEEAKKQSANLEEIYLRYVHSGEEAS